MPGLGKFVPPYAHSSPSFRHVLARKCMLSKSTVAGMLDANLRSILRCARLLENASRVCPLHKLSRHDNCCSYHHLSDKFAVEVDSTLINLRLSLSAVCCAKCWSAQHSCFSQLMLFLFWLTWLRTKINLDVYMTLRNAVGMPGTYILRPLASRSGFFWPSTTP